LLRRELKIRVLLVEYDTLRTEVLSHLRTSYVVTAAALTFLGGLFALGDGWEQRVGIVVLIALVLVAGWAIAVAMELAARRLQKLERKINAIAGERLMVWESDFGGFGKYSDRIGVTHFFLASRKFVIKRVRWVRHSWPIRHIVARITN
jgi:hypothetical protein